MTNGGMHHGKGKKASSKGSKGKTTGSKTARGLAQETLTRGIKRQGPASTRK